MSDKVWLITGASSGFGRSIAEAALQRGDTVVAAIRNPAAAADLTGATAVQLDVTDTTRIKTVVDEVIDEFGRIDVLVNNAGRSQVGAVEETTDEEFRYLMELHFFGPAFLTREVIPHMRKQGSGAIVQMSSIGGQLSFSGFGAYSATKFALEGLSEALNDEVKPFGIKVLIVEPGSFRTSLFGANFHRSRVLPGYEETVGQTRNMVDTGDGTQAGNPAKAAAAIITALDARETPLRLPLGGDAVDLLVEHADRIRDELRAWERVSRDTAYEA